MWIPLGCNEAVVIVGIGIGQNLAGGINVQYVLFRKHVYMFFLFLG